MDAKEGQYSEFSWTVFLQSVLKAQGEKSREQIEQDLWELFPLATERIQ